MPRVTLHMQPRQRAPYWQPLRTPTPQQTVMAWQPPHQAQETPPPGSQQTLRAVEALLQLLWVLAQLLHPTMAAERLLAAAAHWSCGRRLPSSAQGMPPRAAAVAQRPPPYAAARSAAAAAGSASAGALPPPATPAPWKLPPTAQSCRRRSRTLPKPTLVFGLHAQAQSLRNHNDRVRWKIPAGLEQMSFGPGWAARYCPS